MKQTFDYLENVAFAATVCDKESIVPYQNAVSRQRDGGVIGKTWFEVPGGELSGLIELVKSNIVLADIMISFGS